MTSVSIIIVTRNRAVHLVQTLKAITLLSVPESFDVELIIVDNGSSDETQTAVSSAAPQNMKMVYLYEGRSGKSIACNSAMAVAKGEIFLWTDDDVRPPQDWIARMCRPILSGEAQGVSGKIRTASYLERAWMTRTHYDRLSDTRFMPEDFGSMIGANMAFHRNVLQKVPEFDMELGPGKLGFMDDSLFSLRMWEQGFKIIPLPDVIAEHHFDPARIQRHAWLSHGEMSGKSQAYVHHHWEHGGIMLPQLQLLFWQCALTLFRANQPAQSATAEGCHRCEIRIVQKISFIKQFLIERSRPWKYLRENTN